MGPPMPAGGTEEPEWAQSAGGGGTVKTSGDAAQVCLSLALTWP